MISFPYPIKDVPAHSISESLDNHTQCIHPIRESGKRGVYLSWLQCRLLSFHFAPALITFRNQEKKKKGVGEAKRTSRMRKFGRSKLSIVIA